MNNHIPPSSTPVSAAVRLFEALPKYNQTAWSGWDPSVAAIGDVAYVNVREDGDTQTKLTITLHEESNPLYQTVSVTLSSYRGPDAYKLGDDVHASGVHKVSFATVQFDPTTTTREELADRILRAVGLAEARKEG